jgi:hypothetical protein
MSSLLGYTFTGTNTCGNLPQSSFAPSARLRESCRESIPLAIFPKRKELGITFIKMYRLLGRKSKLYTSNKVLIYKTILKPIWTYEYNSGILLPLPTQKSYNASKRNLWVPDTIIRRDLHIPNSWRRNTPLQLSIQCLPQHTPNRFFY